MADYNLGTARGTIELNYRDRGGAKRAEGDLNRVGAGASRTHKLMAGLAVGVAGAGVAIGAGLLVAVKSASDFSTKLSEIKAVSGATQDQMSQISAKALQLGKDTTFSAGEAAGAMIELAKAGVSIPDIMNGAADATVALAAAGGVDLPAAATIASNAMNQFQLSAKDMPKVADLIAGAANASAIDVTDFANSLSYVGPVAHTLGVSLKDTSTAIAILGNQGIKGSAAGTALRSILAQLTPQTKKAKDEFKKLGLVTADGTNLFYDATGKLKPLNDVIQILHDKTKNLTAQQRIAFTKKAFGTEDLAAVSILAGQTGASFDKMTASIGKVTAADVAKTRMDNLGGSVEQLKGSIETLQIEVGLYLQKALKVVVDRANDFVGVLINLTDKIPELAKDVKSFVDDALKLLDKAWNSDSVQRFIGALDTLWNVLRGPLGSALLLILHLAISLAPIIGGVLVVAFTVLSYVMEGIAKTAQFVSDHIRVIGIVAAVAAAILSPILIVLAAQFGLLGVMAIASGIQQVIAWTMSGAAAIRNGAMMLLNSYRLIGQWVAMGLSALGNAALIVAAYISIGAAAIASAIRTAVAWAMQTAAAIAARIVQLASLVMVAIQWAITAAAALVAAAQIALAWLISMGPIVLVVAAVVALAILIATHMNQIRNAISAAWNFAQNISRAVWGAIVSLIQRDINEILSVVRWINRVAGIVRDAFNSAKAGAISKLQELINFVGSLPGRIKSAFGNPRGLLAGIGADIVRGLIGGIGSLAGDVTSALLSLLPGPLRRFAGKLGIASPSKVFHKFGTYIVQGLVNGINSLRGSAVVAAETLAGAVSNAGGAMVGLSSYQVAAASTSPTSDTQQRIIAPASSTYPTLKANDNLIKSQPTQTNHYQVTLQVKMDEIGEVSKLINMVNSIPQASLAGVGSSGDF